MGRNRLLVIDDEPEIGRIIRRVAEGCGYAVEVASDAQTFMAAYRAFKPDVIALDLVMPQTDGVELLRFLAEAKCEARLVIVSGFDPGTVEAAARLGAARGLCVAGTVPKPVRVSALRALLNGMSAMERSQ